MEEEGYLEKWIHYAGTIPFGGNKNKEKKVRHLGDIMELSDRFIGKENK